MENVLDHFSTSLLLVIWIITLSAIKVCSYLYTLKIAKKVIVGIFQIKSKAATLSNEEYA